MTSIKATLCIIVIASGWVLSAHSAPSPQVIDGKYNVLWNNIPLGTMNLFVTQDSDSYRIYTKIRSSGVVRMFKKYKRTAMTEGLINGEDPYHPHFMPQKYEYHSDYGHKRRKVTMNFTEGAVDAIKVTPPDNPDTRVIVTAELAEGASDPLTTLLHIAYHTQSDRCTKDSPCMFHMTDGRRTMIMNVYQIDENQTIEWNGTTREVQHLVGYRIPKHGFSSKEMHEYNKGEPLLHIYLPTEGQRMPLRYSIDLPIGTVKADWRPN